MAYRHTPVLLNEFLEYINCKEGGIYVDATVGNAGHALQLLKQYPKIGLLVGIDCDREAVDLSKKNLAAFSHKTTVVHGNFRQLKKILEQLGIHKIDGILFDLGISMSQLKDPLRGLSFSLKGPLDMRMDNSTSFQAKDLLKQASSRELEKILREYGEEPWAKRISANIKKHLQKSPLHDTAELSDIVLRSIPSKFYPKKIHAATRTFQAIRIAVNDELNSLIKGLDNAIDVLGPAGRICAISFHSLEDRIVKNKFKEWAKGCKCPPGLPFCACNEKKKLKIITKKPVNPSQEEITDNPRARSAKLRAGERLQQ